MGAISPWLGLRVQNEVHRLALAVAAIFSLGWGYFTSPVLFQCLSGIAITGVYRIYYSS
ncbi:MAG: hypothetical protein AAFQ41_01740 [Cyanobacteria bacterium J06623_7]